MKEKENEKKIKITKREKGRKNGKIKGEEESCPEQS